MTQRMTGPALLVVTALTVGSVLARAQATNTKPGAALPNAIATTAIPEPAPKTATPPPSAQARGASPSAPDAAVAPIKGIKVVNFTSEYWGNSAADIVADKPNHVWRSSDANFPQSFVLELPAEYAIAYVIVNNPPYQDPKRTSKDIEVSVSSQGPAFGFGPPVKAALEAGEIGQGVELAGDRRGRWLKIRILSNHGAMDYTTFGMVQVVGKPVTP